MPHIEATVEAVSVKELAQMDSYKNTHRRSLKIGEDWYSCGSGKSDKFNVKNGDGWHQLGKGDKVEFMYQQNGDFKNVQMKTLSLLAVGSNTGSAPKKGVPVNKDFVNPATVGACFNLAVDVLGYEKMDFEDEGKMIEAIKWHKSTFERMYALYPTVSIEDKPKPKKAAPKKEEPKIEYDDDVPFEEEEDGEI